MKTAPLLQRLQGLVPAATATAAAVPAGRGICCLARHVLGSQVQIELVCQGSAELYERFTVGNRPNAARHADQMFEPGNRAATTLSRILVPKPRSRGRLQLASHQRRLLHLVWLAPWAICERS